MQLTPTLVPLVVSDDVVRHTAAVPGVLNRLIAEADNPQADVFWSGDPVAASWSRTSHRLRKRSRKHFVPRMGHGLVLPHGLGSCW